MASTRVVTAIAVSAAFSRAFQRALSITSVRSSLLISPHSMRTSRTPGCTATRLSTSFLICARSGQPPMVSLMPTVTTPSAATDTPGTMPRVTMSAPSSGSITARNSAVTSSTDGGSVITKPMLR